MRLPKSDRLALATGPNAIRRQAQNLREDARITRLQYSPSQGFRYLGRFDVPAGEIADDLERRADWLEYLLEGK